MAGTPKRDATISIEQYQQLVEAHPLPIVETEQGGSAVAYIYGPDGLIAMKSKALYFTLKDRQGSIRQALDTEGGLVAGYDYLPFGGIARCYGPEPALIRYLYTGQELDSETGLYNYRTRLYDSALCASIRPIQNVSTPVRTFTPATTRSCRSIRPEWCRFGMFLEMLATLSSM